MKSKPIIFNSPMVRAILRGQKTQTRRPIDPQPRWETAGGFWIVEKKNKSFWWTDDNPDSAFKHCPYQAGDRLWVKETFAHIYHPISPKLVYRADYEPTADVCIKWKPSIHMRRTASRITLEVTGVRAERLQSISEDDAIAEGVESSSPCGGCGESRWRNCIGCLHPWGDNPKDIFKSLWDSIYGTWDANPWVWVIDFKPVEGSNA